MRGMFADSSVRWKTSGSVTKRQDFCCIIFDATKVLPLFLFETRKETTMKECYQVSKEELLERLQTRETGFTESEAEASRRQHGRNELTEEKKKNAAAIFFGQFKDFLVIILLVAAGVSAFLGDWESALVILIVITMNALLDTIQQIKAEKSLNSLKRLSAPNAKVVRNGELLVIGVEEVVVGDIVLLEAGDYICADGRLIENASLQVNESALTGESLSVDKQDCVIEADAPLGDRVNMVYAGSFVTYGRARFVVTEVGMRTEVGKIATLLKNTAERKTPLQQNLDQFGKLLSIGILIICVVVFVMSILRGEAVLNAFLFAVALAVAAIPEALSSIVTIVLAFGTSKMAKENAIIRKLQAVEGLGSVSVICSDKTGTLTQNRMTVVKCYTDGRITEASQQNPQLRMLTEYGVLCSDATNYDGVEIGDPTEVALVRLADGYGISTKQLRENCPRLAEIPFDSDRKLMSTVHKMEQGYHMITKGAIDVMLGKIKFVLTENGVVPFTKEEEKRLQQVNLDFSGQGLRVLAVGYKQIEEPVIGTEDEKDYILLGLFAMVDPPREESAAAVAECIEAGIRPIMITGDHKITAAAIAKKIGILTEGKLAVEGAEIDAMSDGQLRDFVENVSVYARVSPEHKIRIVRAWQEKGNIVAMTGDGVNDAPALKQADVGVAMGVTGSEVAKDASAVILTDDNFATIVKAVENGRNVYANIKKAIQFLLSGNMAGILTVLYASVLALPVPFAPVHLLFINLLTDSLPAIALGLEPHTKEVMEEKPRSKDESILTKDFVCGVMVEGFVISVCTMLAYRYGLRTQGAELASTMAFATLCLSRLVHGFNSKSKHPVIGTKELFSNKYLWGAFALGVVLLGAVLLIPGLHGVFSVADAGVKELLVIGGLAVLNFPIIQLLKWCAGRGRKMHK